ncbi:hypothetical protein B0O79_2961 [Flavobacteriaceae bacterium MAR_2009_75]|nr:hypothetical protein B0O79_2961 [Flavobacteriaceae bacterium MAR_2009_75]
MYYMSTIKFENLNNLFYTLNDYSFTLRGYIVVYCIIIVV